MAFITVEQCGANVPAFLDLIAYSEGTSASKLTKNDGYDVIVSGIRGPEVFTEYANHPFALRPPQIVNHAGLESTAAGRYQLLYRYWIAYRTTLNLKDFTPLSQDFVAVQQIREVHALPFIEIGDFATAIDLCGHLWASFPNNAYGQGGKSLDALLAKAAELTSVPTASVDA